MFSVLFPVSYTASSSKQLISLYKAKEITPLGRGEGYLLIELELNGTSATLEFVELNVRGQSYLKSGQKPKVKGYKKTIDFNGKTPGFYLAKVPAGLYQIKQSNL